MIQFVGLACDSSLQLELIVFKIIKTILDIMELFMSILNMAHLREKVYSSNCNQLSDKDYIVIIELLLQDKSSYLCFSEFDPSCCCKSSKIMLHVFKYKV
jgi:hypothetical protein